jgi:phosphatidylglycerol:prolipoprotein diacylglycerol transferase
VRPVLFHVGAFGVPTHETFTVLGLIVAGGIVLHQARASGRLDDRMWWVIAGAVVGAAIGSRSSTLWTYVATSEHPTLAGAALDGGKSVLGGLPGAYVGVLVAKRATGLRRSTGDLFAPAVALGMAVGRVGCFLTERIGTPTSLPWGIAVDAQSAARIPDCAWCEPGVRMHPSMLYEIGFQLAMFAVLWRLRGRLKEEGDLFKLDVFAYALFRLAVEFVRGSPAVFAGLTRPQLFLVPSILAFSVYITWRSLQRAPEPAAAA